MRKKIISLFKKKKTYSSIHSMKFRNIDEKEIFDNHDEIIIDPIDQIDFLGLNAKNKNKRLAQDRKAQREAFEKSFPIQEVTGMDYSSPRAIPGQAMDNAVGGTSIKPFFHQAALPAALSAWYATHSFIGFQNCALLAQHWLIEKCCSMPADDAIRKGYEITMNDGADVPDEISTFLRKMDRKYNILGNLTRFCTKGRMFGLNVAIYDIETDDPDDFYFKPFNIDGVKPGSYKGIIQVDPMWIVGQLGYESASNPDSQHFYEPEWWLVNGRRIHRSHLVIYRNGHLPNVLKPSYFYGSVSIPQKIYQRVYCAERTANEAPLLALTKRSTTYKTDLSQAMGKQIQLESKIQNQVELQNNYGINVIDHEDSMEQRDTALADLDMTIMSQYQIVSATVNIPSSKLMNTQLKGFNTTGEYEEASYHEMLESIQSHKLTPLLDGHYQRLIKSDILPNFEIDPFEIEICWVPLDALTELEQAQINKTKSETDEAYMRTGVFSGEEIKKKVINDPQSGFNGMAYENDNQEEEDENQDLSDVENWLKSNLISNKEKDE